MTLKQNNPSKTLGRRSASLVTALHERGRPIFTLADAQDITGMNLCADLGPQTRWPRRGDAAHTRSRSGKGLLPGVVSDRAFADAATGAAGFQRWDVAQAMLLW